MGGSRIRSWALVALFLPGAAHAGVGAWTSGGPYGTGYVSAIASDLSSPSTLYAGTMGGVFRSTDSGATWALAGVGDFGIFSLAVSPSTPTTIYAGCSSGRVYRSTDAGSTWATGPSLFGDGIATALAVHPTTPSTVYGGWTWRSCSQFGCVYGATVEKSTDSGRTWTWLWDKPSASHTDEISALLIDPTDPTVLYAAIFGGVYKSTDSGLRWSPANAGLPDPDTLDVTALAMAPSNRSVLYAGTSRGVFRTTDSGGTWAAASTGLPNVQIASLAIDPSAASTIYAGTGMLSAPGAGGGVFKSSDGGGTWAAASTGLTNFDVIALSVDPVRPSTIVAGTSQSGAFRSTDSGASWTPASTGISVLNTWALAVSPSVPSTLYAGTYGKWVFRSTDSGGSWARIDGTPQGPIIGAFAVDPATSSTLYGAAGPDVFKSTDAGATWTQATPRPGVSISSLVVDPLMPSRLWVGSSGGVFRSSDAGHSWAESSVGLTVGGVGAIAVAPGRTSTLYAAVGSRVFRSTDNGDTWAPEGTIAGNVSVTGFAIAPAPSATMYAMGQSGLYNGTVFRSTDSGETWAASNAGLGNLYVTGLAIHPTAPSTVYAGTYGGGVFRSTDSGIRWESMSTGLVNGYVRALAISSSSHPTLYARLLYGSVWQFTPTDSPVTVPIVLSNAGLSGAFFTSELALTNPSGSDASLRFTYSPAFGGTGATASDALAAGKQKIVPDAIAYLKSLGMPLDEAASRGGTLRIEFSGAGAASTRTTTAVPGGRAGLAYRGMTDAQVLRDPVVLCGLRRTDTDRSNVAVLNAGAAGEAAIALRLTVISGDPAHPKTQALPDITLAPGEFRQVNGVLASNGLDLTNGYVKAERVSGSALFYAYGVINDNASSDGSFVQPALAGPAAPIARATLPVLVETSASSTELVVTNFTSSPRTIHGVWVAKALTGGEATFDIALLPNEQQILPAFVQVLRDRLRVVDPPGPGYAGAVFFTDSSGDMRGLSIAARTSTPGESGRYGVFYSAVPAGAEATATARLYGLRQDAENRTNLALVNVGSADSSPDSFAIEIYEGATGELAGSLTGVSVPAKGFVQINSVLAQIAARPAQGYAVVRRTAGSNPFIACAVVNDGGNPGERSGDGAFIEAEKLEP